MSNLLALLEQHMTRCPGCGRGVQATGRCGHCGGQAWAHYDGVAAWACESAPRCPSEGHIIIPERQA